jgi:hypothetical protein
MHEEYDYVLIDSRTGITDISGICTVQMPDKVVLCFSYNNQSIDGTAAVISAISAQRTPPPLFFPVPMRFDAAEKAKLDRARVQAQARLGSYPAEYWASVEIPYVPYYAFEETLATFGDDPFSQTSLLAATERLTGWLTGKRVTRFPPVPPEQREGVLERFRREIPRP